MSIKQIKILQDLNGVIVYYSLIKAENLIMSESILLSIFNQIDISNKIPSNKELAKFTGVGKSAISNNISNLLKKGYLLRAESITDKEAYRLLNKVDSKSGCKFCGYDTVTLDEHHYPIRAKDKGIETIYLCPNCHRKFHEMTDHNRKVKLSKKTLKMIK